MYKVRGYGKENVTATGAYFARWIGGMALAQQYISSVYNSSLDLSLNGSSKS
ncbi:MAG TPA: hypothetical protein VGI33_10165 [Paenibacillus sp.]